MNDAHITLVGNLVSDPQHSSADDGVARTTFRFAHTPRRRRDDGWVDGETTFYQVTCWRQLAENAARSLRRGDPVIVRGMLRGREWSNAERSGTSLEISADSIGHDLNRGITSLWRLPRATRGEGAPSANSDADAKPQIEQTAA
jgi:single-strand DNA-binding protein